jgi:hypothetical protein
VLKLGQEVLHDGTQILLFDVVDMHRLNHTIAEVMKFWKGLSIKQNLKSKKLWSISSILSFETNTSWYPEFL